MHTDFIQEHYQTLFPPPAAIPDSVLAQTALVFLLHHQELQHSQGISLSGKDRDKRVDSVNGGSVIPSIVVLSVVKRFDVSI